MSKTWYATPCSAPGELAVENHVSHGEFRDRVGDGGQILRQPVAREQPHIRRRAGTRAGGCRRTCARKVHSGPAKRSCVSVAAIGSSHSGKGTTEIMTQRTPRPPLGTTPRLR